MIRRTLLLLLLGLLASPAQAQTPLTLNAAIKQALATHPDSLIADSQAAVSDLAVADANSQRAQLSLDASALGRGSDSRTFGGTSTVNDTSQTGVNGAVSLTIPLFTGFKITHQVQAAEANRTAVLAQRTTTRAQLTMQVTQAFWNLRKAELTEEVQQATVTETERTLKLTRTGFTLGRLPSSQVDQAEVSELNARNDQLRYQSDTREARVTLASLLGMDPEDVQVDGTPDAATALSTPGASEVDRLMAQRPELQAAEAQLSSARASLAAAGGDRWPQLALVLGYQLGNNPYDPTLASRLFSNSMLGNADARLTASYNLWDGGKTERAIARATAQVQQAQAQLEKMRRQVKQEVATAQIRLKSAHDRRVMAEKSASIADRGLHWTEARFEQGYSGQIEVDQALGSMVTARMQRVQALVDEQLARAELSRALGTL